MGPGDVLTCDGRDGHQRRVEELHVCPGDVLTCDGRDGH